METISEHTGQLMVIRCWCGIQHAVPESLRKLQIRQRDSGETMVDVYCPIGHRHYPAGQSEADRLRKVVKDREASLAWERSRHDQTKAQLRDTESRRRAEKAAKTRLKNRVSKGVCPCCNRHFENLERHMKGQHPDYTTAGE